MKTYIALPLIFLLLSGLFLPARTETVVKRFDEQTHYESSLKCAAYEFTLGVTSPSLGLFNNEQKTRESEDALTVYSELFRITESSTLEFYVIQSTLSELLNFKLFPFHFFW